MSETRKIKVKRVEAADPKLTVTLDADDSGTFPTHVKVDATISNTADGGNYSGSGQTAPGNTTSTEVSVEVDFTDSSYASETTLNYSLTIYFSSDGVNWTQVPAANVTGASGSTPATHSGDTDVEEKVATPAEAGAKNKGCLGALFAMF